MRLGKIGLRPAGRVVGVGVVETDDVFSALAAFALDFDQLFGVYVVAVVGGVGASVAGPCNGCDSTSGVVELAEQDSAAFVRVGFFSVLAEGVVELAGNF